MRSSVAGVCGHVSVSMAMVIGQVQEFDTVKEDWLQYVKWLEQFFIANGIEEGKKRAVLLLAVVRQLLSCCGV